MKMSNTKRQKSRLKFAEWMDEMADKLHLDKTEMKRAKEINRRVDKQKRRQFERLNNS